MDWAGYTASLSKRINDRNLRIAVVGLGYVGLPTAIAFHNAGYEVFGIDSSEEVLKALRSGTSPVTDEIGLDVPFDERWRATSDFEEAISGCDVVLVCVPTPVGDSLEPNLAAVDSSLSSIVSAKHNDQELVVVMESTVQPGTTRRCLQNITGSSDPSEHGIHMAYCPERVSPGEGGYGVGDVGRVIGSCSAELTETLADLYRGITNGTVTPVSSIEVAEASKLVENAQRDIDIAFTNELAILLPKLGLDVQEVLKAAETKWNFHRHTPGIGVGGHCIPVDPHYYMEIARRYGVVSALSPAARELNSSMPKHNALEVLRLCNSTHPDRLLVMGYAYKPNVSDTRGTPVEHLVQSLFENGTKEIYVWDPLIGDNRIREPARRVSDPYDLEGIDCIVIGTAHDAVIDADWGRLSANLVSPRIYDGRRCLDPKVMIESGWAYHAIGRPFEEVLG